MISSYSQAIDLIIQDLYTSHSEIRNEAKMLNCETELLRIRDDVISYLKYQKLIQD
jgi:hypothetical protein